MRCRTSLSALLAATPAWTACEDSPVALDEVEPAYEAPRVASPPGPPGG